MLFFRLPNCSDLFSPLFVFTFVDNTKSGIKIIDEQKEEC